MPDLYPFLMQCDGSAGHPVEERQDGKTFLVQRVCEIYRHRLFEQFPGSADGVSAHSADNASGP